MATPQRQRRQPHRLSAHRFPFAFCAVALVLASLTACVSPPTSAELLRTPPVSRHAGDARAQFRATFCNHYAQQGSAGGMPTCDYWLWRLPDEAPAASAVPGSPVDGPSERVNRSRVLIIPGAFGECFGEDANPFGDAIPALRAKGYAIDTVPVEGRSGTPRNAKIIASWIDAHSPAGESLILLGYSKGAADILQYLTDFPGSAQRVKAVISIAGAAAGTPLADSNAALFDLTGAFLPNSHCSPGDRQVLDSLRSDTRTAWLNQHPLPAGVQYYSLAAFTTHDRVAHALLPTWRVLLRHDAHTDGQILAGNSVIPGSTLLGFVNADHWEVALGIEHRFGFLAGRKATTAFPREVLLESVLEVAATSVSRPPLISKP